MRSSRRRTIQSIAIIDAIDGQGEIQHPVGSACACGLWQISGIYISNNRTTFDCQPAAVAAPVARHPKIGLNRIHRELRCFLNSCDGFIDNERLPTLCVYLNRADHQERPDGKCDHQFDHAEACLLAYVDRHIPSTATVIT